MTFGEDQLPSWMERGELSKYMQRHKHVKPLHRLGGTKVSFQSRRLEVVMSLLSRFDPLMLAFHLNLM